MCNACVYEFTAKLASKYNIYVTCMHVGASIDWMITFSNVVVCQSCSILKVIITYHIKI